MNRQLCKTALTLLLSLLLWQVKIGFAAYELAVINTHQNPKNLIPIMQPLFGKQASFTSQGYKLIVKASPQTINEIKDLLKEIDVPLQNLVIRFANREQIDKRLKNTSVEGRIDISNNQSISSRNPDTDGNIQYTYREDGSRVKVISTHKRSRYDGNSNYEARVLEGSWVYINTGQQVPYQTYQYHPGKKDRDRNRPYYGSYSTEFVNVYSGFDAKAHLSGNDKVVLHIKPHQKGMNREHPKRIDVKSMQTTVSGRLGEWLPIGQALNTVGNNVKGITYQTRNRNQDNFQFYIQVNKVNE